MTTTIEKANNLSVLETNIVLNVKDARKVLEEAIGEGFETVLVVGLKDDKVYFKNSKAIDTLHKIGMIDFAKMEFWKSWG